MLLSVLILLLHPALTALDGPVHKFSLLLLLLYRCYPIRALLFSFFGCDWSERLLFFSSHEGEFYREMVVPASRGFLGFPRV